MFTVIVDLTVRPDRVDDFLEAIHTNARASLSDEPGCLRFDVHRSGKTQTDSCSTRSTPSRCLLQRPPAAPHYAVWREVGGRCVEEGGHVNTFAVPAFPETSRRTRSARAATWTAP